MPVVVWHVACHVRERTMGLQSDELLKIDPAGADGAWHLRADAAWPDGWRSRWLTPGYCWTTP